MTNSKYKIISASLPIEDYDLAMAFLEEKGLSKTEFIKEALVKLAGKDQKAITNWESFHLAAVAHKVEQENKRLKTEVQSLKVLIPSECKNSEILDDKDLSTWEDKKDVELICH